MREIIGYKGKSGSGGGGGSETPDSLHSISYAKVLDLVSEGEIQGLVDGMKSVYFNETPLQNADGTYNFKGATVDFRPGTQVQDPIDGFPDVSNEIGVGVELRSTSPWTKSLSNTQLTSISIRLGINALTKADTSNGNINGYTVAYKIELSTDGSAYEVVVDSAFSGKTTSQYQRSHRIKLPKAMTGWTVRVVRTTPNANSSTTADTTSILTYTELIDARMRYPMSAIVGVQIDAAQFQSIPARAYDLYGRILSVPSNYDPVARTYSGIWDGTFKPAWSNNPAWIFYDLLINARYGLGNLIPSSYVDKWSLYQIAQYCDQIVPDGHGGTEPRFTCNLYLQSAAEAYKVLQDLAALFRGITYWAGGTIVASADMPQDPTYIFTAANVIDGKFHNTGSSKKTRYTVAVVSWNDPANFYKLKAEYVQDDEGLIRYGVQQLNLTAFGCTSQGQAQRAGKWALLTSRLETDVVTFSVALDALVVTPGQVVRIANPNKAGRRNGGRIRAAVGRVVTLDKAPVIAAGDSLSVILPTGISETKTVESISSNDVTVSGDWSVLPQAPAIWSVESTNLVAPTYRIISITQKDSLSFEISAIRHEPGKFGYIDNGTKIQAQPVTIQKSIPDTPTNLMFSSTPYWVDDSVSAVDGILSWTGTAPNYLVSYRHGDDVWTDKNVSTSSIDIKAMQPGDYSFSVTAVSSTGLKSQAATYTATVTPQLPPLPAVTGLVLESAFTTNSAKLKWNGVIGATSYKMSVVANGVTVRTVTLGDSLRYEYSTADMKADGGPWRNVSFNVQAFGKFGTQSPIASISATNPQIGALTNIRIDAGIRTGFFKCTPPGDEDFAGIIVWISTDPTCPATDGNKVYDGQDTFVTISNLGDGITSLDGDATYYVRAAAYDTFGKDSLTISSAIVFTAVANAPDANSITAAMIKAGALDITKFASGLQPVGIVNSLPAVAGYTGPTIVTLTTDGKLYRLVGGVWTAEVKTTDLAGQLTDAQLSTISAAKVSGQLVSSQIAAAAITADKLGVTLGGGNLTPNSSFENVAAGSSIADGWSIYNNSSNVPTYSAMAAGRLSGAAQKIYWNTNNDGNQKGIFGPVCQVGWVAGKTYVLSFYASTSSLNIQTTMGLRFNINPASVVPILNPELHAPWQRYAFRIAWGSSVQPYGIAFITIENQSASIGDIIFDDVQVTEGDTLTGYAPMIGEILPGAVTNLQLAANAVTAAKTAIAAIDPSTGNLTANSVTAAQIVAGAVTAISIQVGSITGDRLAANTIGANQIEAGSITGDRLRANTVTAAQIDSRSLSIRDADGNIILAAGTPLAASNITPDAGWLNGNINLTSTGALQGAGGGQIDTIRVRDVYSERTTDRPPAWYPVGTTKEFKSSVAIGLSGQDEWCTLETIIQYLDSTGGDAYQYAYCGVRTFRRTGQNSASVWSGSWVQDLDRAAYTGDLNATNGAAFGVNISGQITSANAATYIANAAIQDALINNLNGNKIIANSITASQLAAGSVTAGSIAAGEITTPALSVGAVTAINIAAGNVTASALATDAVVAGKIAAGAINARELAAGAVTAGKLFVQAAGSALNRDPNFTDPSAWTVDVNVSFAEANFQYPVAAPGASANTCIYPQNYAGTGNAELWISENALIPLDPARTYRLSGSFYTDPGNGRSAFLRAVFYDSSLNYIESSWVGYAWIGVPISSQFSSYNGVFGAGTDKPIPPNATQCKLRVILNYGTGGYNLRMAAQSVRLEEVLPGTLIQDGAITTQKITAAAITGDKVAANTITATHIIANSITGDRLQVGSVSSNVFSSGIAGNNLLDNSAFAVTFLFNGVNYPDGYLNASDIVNVSEMTMGVDLISAEYHPPGISGLVVRQAGTSGQGNAAAYYDVHSPLVACSTGQWMEASFYSGAYRCSVSGYLKFCDANGNALSYAKLPDNTGVPAGTTLSAFYRHSIVAQAPNGTVTCRLLFRKLPTNAGQSDSYMMVQCPMIAAAMSGNQTAPSPWSPAGIGTQINGGILKANTVTADRMAVQQLSAISANLGAVTAGSININNRFIVGSDGTTTIQSSTTGQRSVMSNGLFQVYDSNNTLRVQLGIW